MRFDWYTATIKQAPLGVIDTLAQELHASVVAGHAGHGYEFGVNLERDDSTICRVLFGGANGDPHVIVSSDDCDEVVPIIRAAWRGEHYCTRVDAAEDIDEGPGTWERLFDMVRSVAECDNSDHVGGEGCAPGACKRRRLKISTAGDWLRPANDPEHEGRTFYVGSPKSAVRLRLYEKGKELNGKAIGGRPFSPTLCRVEVQIRPEKDSRWIAARGTAEDAWGYAEWTRDLLKRLKQAEVDRVHIRERRESDLERALHWLCHQYGEHLTTLATSLGSDDAPAWDRLGAELRDRIHRVSEPVPF